MKCTTDGEYSQVSKTVVFPNIRCAVRTDEKFRRKEYGKQDSPILKIPGFDMVQDVIIADSLHLLELGVMKRCLVGWRDGSLGYAGKLSARQIEKLSIDIQNVKLPSEIHRATRGLDCIAHWKGVEWHNLLNYFGIVVLKDLLNENVYNHFLLLFVAVTICSCDIYSCHWSTAQLMFEKYIEEYKNIYGTEYVTSNVHNLEHIVNDVVRFGSLQTISAYPFENCLYQIKNMIRHGNNSLQQVANRMYEQNNPPKQCKEPEKHFPSVKITRGKVQCQINESFILNDGFRNSWFLTKEKDIVRMITAKSNSKGCISIHGRPVKFKQNFFEIPVYSSLLHIYMGDISNLHDLKVFEVDNIFCKLVAIPYREQVVFIPLQHTLPHKSV